MANVVSGSTTQGAALVTYGMNGGPNVGLLFAGNSGTDTNQGAQIEINNTATGAVTPIKYIRVSVAGTLDFMSNAYARMGRFLDDGHFNSTLPFFQTASVPTFSTACGTSPSGSADSNASSTGATITIGGGSPSTCVVTFNPAFVNWNHCVLSFESGTPKAYVYTKTTLTITSPVSGSLVDMKCDGD